MGCSQSKIETEEAVCRCKDRNLHLRNALSSRNAFAAAHSSYSVTLKNIGAALSDYALGEAPDHRSHPSSASAAVAAAAPPSATAAVAVHPPVENLPPPPPPLPDFNQQTLQRAATMPELVIPKPLKKPPLDQTIREEDEGDELDEVIDAAAETPPVPPQPIPSPAPPPPMPVSKGIEDTWDYFFGVGENMPGPTLESTRIEIEEEAIKKSGPVPPPPSLPPAAAAAVGSDPFDDTPERVVVEPPQQKLARKPKGSGASGGGDSKKGRMVPAPARSGSLLQVLNELDEHFLKAYESAHEVSKMLEATRMHYHSNFADNRGHIDHSAKVMQVITWNRSIKGLPVPDDVQDAFDSEELETHATVLDKMLAWEKKLYDEVKAAELMKIEYQKKIAALTKQKKRGNNPEALEKAKSAVSYLHTRYIVDMQSMDSTVAEINRLRDDRLYPKLVELVDGMAKMWEAMYIHHGNQLKIVVELRTLNVTVATKETSEQHHEGTIQLWESLREWHTHFQKLMQHQKEYVRHLNSWLKSNLIPIESSLKEKVSSPPRVHQPPIQALLHEWHEQLGKVPDELARGAIYAFSEVVHTIVIHQEDELKLKEKCEETRREYMRKVRGFEDWHRKYMEKKAAAAASASAEAGAASEEADPENHDVANENDPVMERKIAVETVKMRLESEMEAHQKLCKQVREKSLGSLRTHLPELFRAMSDFSLACSETYKKLTFISRPINPEDT